MTSLTTTRRGFFRNLAIAAGGVIVAPTVAETLAVNAKKYFFLQGNPLSIPPNMAYLISLLKADPMLAPRILRDPVSIRKAGVVLLGIPEDEWRFQLRLASRHIPNQNMLEKVVQS